MSDVTGLPPFSAAFRESYTALRLLGAGGMAQVFRAHHTALDRPVAIKVIQSAAADERARFAREAKSLAALSHPAIVRLYESGLDGDLLYLVMELVEGETVEARCESAPLPQAEVLRIADQVAQALEFAHQRGIVHRDVKPANVFLTQDGAVKLGDFGLARAVAHGSTITRPELVMGTPHFMAPEQVTGAPIGPAVDQYALGVMIFWMATGQLPHEGETAMEILTRRTSVPARPLPGASRGLTALVARMLERDASARFVSMTEVRAHLAVLLSGGQPAATSVHSAPGVRSGATRITARRVEATPAPRKVSRGPAIALAVLLAAGGAVVVQSTRRPPPSASARSAAPVVPAAGAQPASPAPSAIPWPIPQIKVSPVAKPYTAAIQAFQHLRPEIDSDPPQGETALGTIRQATGMDLGTRREYWRGWYAYDDWLEGRGGDLPPRLPHAVKGKIPDFDFTLAQERMHRWLADDPRHVAEGALGLAMEAPDDWRCWLFLGRVLEHEGRLEPARRVYRLALKLPKLCSGKNWPWVLGEALVSALVEQGELEARLHDLLACQATQGAIWPTVRRVLEDDFPRFERMTRVAMTLPGRQVQAAVCLGHWYKDHARILEAQEAFKEGIDRAVEDPQQARAVSEAMGTLQKLYLGRGDVALAGEMERFLTRNSEQRGRFSAARGDPRSGPAPTDEMLVSDDVRRVWAYRLAECGRIADAERLLDVHGREWLKTDQPQALQLGATLARRGSKADWIEAALAPPVERDRALSQVWPEIASVLAAQPVCVAARVAFAKMENRDPSSAWPLLARALEASRAGRDATALLAAALANPRAGELEFSSVLEVAFRGAFRALTAGETDRARALARAAGAALPAPLVSGWDGNVAFVAPLAEGDFARAAAMAEVRLNQQYDMPLWYLIPVWWHASTGDAKRFNATRERALLSLRSQHQALWAVDELLALQLSKK